MDKKKLDSERIPITEIRVNVKALNLMKNVLVADHFNFLCRSIGEALNQVYKIGYDKGKSEFGLKNKDQANSDLKVIKH